MRSGTSLVALVQLWIKQKKLHRKARSLFGDFRKKRSPLSGSIAMIGSLSKFHSETNFCKEK
jgi:hypothetical protein